MTDNQPASGDEPETNNYWSNHICTMVCSHKRPENMAKMNQPAKKGYIGNLEGVTIMPASGDRLEQQLHRLIIEQRDETGAIDASDQSAMADEIMELFRQHISDGIGEYRPMISPQDNWKDKQWHQYFEIAGYNGAVTEIRTRLGL